MKQQLRFLILPAFLLTLTVSAQNYENFLKHTQTYIGLYKNFANLYQSNHITSIKHELFDKEGKLEFTFIQDINEHGKLTKVVGYTPKGEVKLSNVLTYNEFNLLLQESVVENNGDTIKQLNNKYDSLGRVTHKTERYKGNNTAVGYAYDNRGLLTSEVLSMNGQLISITKYSYDLSGNLIKSEKVTDTQKILGVTLHGCEPFNLDSVTEEICITKQPMAKGGYQQTTKFTNVHGGILSQIYTYNSDSVLIRWHTTNTNNVVIRNSIYEIDKNGNRTKLTAYDEQGNVDRKHIYLYNKRGLLDQLKHYKGTDNFINEKYTYTFSK